LKKDNERRILTCVGRECRNIKMMLRNPEQRTRNIEKALKMIMKDSE
jgi:hypothetical protein